MLIPFIHLYFFFFFKDTATTEIYTLSLHDALPISTPRRSPSVSHPPSYTDLSHAWTRDHRRSVGRRREGKGHGPARGAGRRCRPLPGREQRRPHDRS